MKHVLLVIMICVGMNSYSQNEFNTKFKPIPPANTSVVPKTVTPKETLPTKVETKTIVTPNIFDKPDVVESNSNFNIGESKPVSMIKTNDFVNPGDKVKDNLNKDLDKTLIRHGLKEDDSYIRRTDVNFGVFKTKSNKLIVRVRDYGAIDGDLIKASLINEYKTTVLANNLSMQAVFIDIKVDLNVGVNFLELEALNRGALGGNTGNFEIYDEEGKLLLNNYWDNIDTGVKSKFTFIKE